MCRQVPKRIYTLEEMRLNKVEPTSLLSPTDDTLNGVRTIVQVGPAAAALLTHDLTCTLDRFCVWPLGPFHPKAITCATHTLQYISA